MKRREAFPSKYLSKEDVAAPMAATILAVRKEELEGESGKTTKPVIFFAEPAVKPLILNHVNWLTIEEAYGDESDDWSGSPIQVYCDPEVLFGNERVGGVRVRIPSPNVTPQPRPGAAKTAAFIIRDARAWNELRAWAIAQTFVDDDAKAGFRLQNVLKDAGMREFTAASAEPARAAIEAHYNS